EEYVRLVTGTQIGVEGKRRKVTMSHCNGCKATRIETVDSLLRPEELAGLCEPTGRLHLVMELGSRRAEFRPVRLWGHGRICRCFDIDKESEVTALLHTDVEDHIHARTNIKRRRGRDVIINQTGIQATAYRF